RSQCSDEDWVKPRIHCPALPEVEVKVSSRADESGDIVPVLFLTLTEPPDGSVFTVQGTEVNVLEVTTNSSLCIRYMFPEKIPSVLKEPDEPWTFTLDRIVADPGLKYQVSASNLPKPDVGTRSKVQEITVPGCQNREMQKLKACLENGSLWDPNLTWAVLKTENGGGTITMTFNTGQFSELYRVDVHQPDFHTNLSLTVSKDNRTSVNASFPVSAWQLKGCGFVFVIKPFFVRCMNSCSEYQETVQICSHTYPSSHNPTDQKEVESVPVHRPSKLFIIYSLDHPLYKEIVLKLCAFLRAKCGTEVTLDLLDFTWLSTVGTIQWLDMQRERLSRCSDKVLILCSPGVYAKWRGMCGGKRVMTREDIRSPIGDMLTPALSLIIPDFVQASSFQKYIVAYFDDVCSKKDVPALFNVAVKYQLMKHFEELFFRLMNNEKHEPGRIKQVEGIGGNDYFHSLPGRALKDAIETFQAYQLANPNWFEMEIVDTNGELEENGHEQDTGSETNRRCALQNQLWAREITTHALINNVEGQMHMAEPIGPTADCTVSDFSLNGIYPTIPLVSTLSSQISHTGSPNKPDKMQK
ncbi:hypothetical protein NFI96_013619, partial [Prochilodus magdalenae]